MRSAHFRVFLFFYAVFALKIWKIACYVLYLREIVEMDMSEIVDIKRFRENADREGICKELSRQWDRCANKKQLMDVALCAQGLDYMAYSIAAGWGISPREIQSKFGSFNNGRYVYYSPAGYTSTMYCGFAGMVSVETTALLVIDCDIELDIPSWHICEVYATGRSRLRLKGGGRCVVIAYGSAENIEVEVLDKRLQYKRLNKDNKD